MTRVELWRRISTRTRPAQPCVTGSARDRLARRLERRGTPAGLGFVFDRHRINVATSRAQCRVELVCSPRLLEADVKTVEQMQLVTLCRFVELASVPLPP